MDRIRFANQLRGVAALGVAASHLIGVFWALPEVVSAATFSPAQTGRLPGLFALVAHPWFNLGPFGVGLFFLISGLVIPISLERHSRGSFLLARALRIYPVVIAALLLEVLVLHGAAWGWGRPFTYGPAIIAGNALLVYDLLGQPSIDLVNWTLSVELKFYLLVALLAPSIRRGSAAMLVLTALGLFAANALLAGTGLLGPPAPLPSSPLHTFSSQSLCLIYMLLGTLFNFHLRGRIGTAGLLASLVALSLAFVATWRVGVWSTQYPVVTVNYAYALGIFGLLYAGRRFVPANPLLDAVAAISFPFYLLHSLLGFSILRGLMVGLGIGYYPALFGALAGVAVAATALHVAVERPAIRAGRRLTARPGTPAVT